MIHVDILNPKRKHTTQMTTRWRTVKNESVVRGLKGQPRSKF